jgi:hypothetical protein
MDGVPVFFRRGDGETRLDTFPAVSDIILGVARGASATSHFSTESGDG